MAQQADVEKSSAAETIDGHVSHCSDKDAESSPVTRDWSNEEERKIKFKYVEQHHQLPISRQHVTDLSPSLIGLIFSCSGT